MPDQHRILVPFSWAAPASGVGESPDSASIGWYARDVTVPAAWQGRRVFVVFGASDWRTSAWLDGQKLGDHQGGYTPFSLEITPLVRGGQSHRLVVRVDDADHPFKLEGKQGYGKARGMWQTVYLEARGGDPLEAIHFTPRADLAGVGVDARLRQPAPRDLTLRLTFTNRDGSPSRYEVMTAVPDKRISDAIWNAIQGCKWIPGADAQGKPTAIWVILPLRFTSG